MLVAYGALVPITTQVRDAAGVLTNATTVTLEIQRPDGVIDAPAVANPPTVTGTYAYDYTPPVPDGDYDWNMRTTGPSTGLSGSFYVMPKFPRLIIDIGEAKEQLNIASSVSDLELVPYVWSATNVIDDHTGLTTVRDTITDELHVDLCGQREVFLHHHPVMSVTSIAAADGGSTWNPNDWRLDPSMGRLRRLRGSYLSGDVLFGYVAGMRPIAPKYTMAARIVVQHLWTTQRGQKGGPRVGGMDPGSPGLMPSGFAIPNAALELLGPRGLMVA